MDERPWPAWAHPQEPTRPVTTLQAWSFHDALSNQLTRAPALIRAGPLIAYLRGGVMDGLLVECMDA